MSGLKFKLPDHEMSVTHISLAYGAFQRVALCKVAIQGMLRCFVFGFWGVLR